MSRVDPSLPTAQIAGVVLSAAIGDALGYPVEFASIAAFASATGI